MVVQDHLRIIEQLPPAPARRAFRKMQLEIVAHGVVRAGALRKLRTGWGAQVPAVVARRIEFEAGIAKQGLQLARDGGAFRGVQAEFTAGQHARSGHVRPHMGRIGAKPRGPRGIAAIVLPAQCGDRQCAPGPVEARLEATLEAGLGRLEPIATRGPAGQRGRGDARRPGASPPLRQQQHDLVHEATQPAMATRGQSTRAAVLDDRIRPRSGLPRSHSCGCHSEPGIRNCPLRSCRSGPGRTVRRRK